MRLFGSEIRICQAGPSSKSDFTLNMLSAGGIFRLLNMKWMHIAVLDDDSDGTEVKMRVSGLHDDENEGDRVSVYP